jgi:hypothetical protein
MGGFGSTRWAGYTRRATVEECQRIYVSSCPVCGRRARFAYLPETIAVTPVGNMWACRRCHNLSYYSRQTWGTFAGDLIRQPGLIESATDETLSLLSTHGFPSEEPPREIKRQGRRAVARWFRQRDTNFRRASTLLAAIDRVPPELQQAALRRSLPQRALKRRLKARQQHD